MLIKLCKLRQRKFLDALAWITIMKKGEMKNIPFALSLSRTYERHRRWLANLQAARIPAVTGTAQSHHLLVAEIQTVGKCESQQEQSI